MAVSTAVLRELHRIHRQLGDLRDRLARGPRQVLAREANVEKLNQQLNNAEEKVQQLKLAVDSKQLDLKSGENKIADWKTKLNTCNSNKEFHALQEQIAAADMAGSVLADEILEGLEKIDQLEAAVVEARQQAEAGKEDLSRFQDSVSEEASVIGGDIERLERELGETEKQIPSDFRQDYLRVIRGKGAEGMAEVEDGVCLGCGQQITLNMQNDLLLSKPIFCRACGCLLYMGEG